MFRKYLIESLNVALLDQISMEYLYVDRVLPEFVI